jgi:zinc-ribbon domain
MKSVWKWILFGLAVFVLAFCIGLPLFSRSFLLPGRMMFNRGMMPFGMMGVGALGWLGILARLAIPILFVVLVVALVVMLVRKPSTPPTPPAPETTPCAKCGMPIQQGWVACPYCGKKL